jgi:ribosome-binding factor A
MDLEKEYQQLANKIREVYFPILKEKRATLKYSKHIMERMITSWGIDPTKQTNYTPEVIFKLDKWLDEQLKIKQEMEKINV